ncbi:hypothetical protein TNCV_3815961 [Trichonephila clavipes]|nr:hypothetical protein TNCV_3815961 [Trichonephila clavipes]
MVTNTSYDVGRSGLGHIAIWTRRFILPEKLSSVVRISRTDPNTIPLVDENSTTRESTYTRAAVSVDLQHITQDFSTFVPLSVNKSRKADRRGLLELMQSHQKCFAAVLEDYEGCCGEKT